MVKNKKQTISKMTLDEKDLKSTTMPDPVVTGGLEAIGIHRIEPIEIPKYLLMHPALPRGIEIKANRMIVLVDEDLAKNIIINKTKTNIKEINSKDINDLRIEAKNNCREILDNSGGPLFLKKFAMGAYRFGTSFAVLQTNKAETKVLRFEYQHEIFFGAARYPTLQKGANVNWGSIPMSDRKNMSGKIKIDRKTKKISKYTQLTYQYPQSYADNYKPGSNDYVDTNNHPRLKNKYAGPLVQVGREYDQDEVIQLFFDSIGDEPLGISLVQYLHLTIKYLLNMERGAAQTQVNFGFNKWVAETPFKSQDKMKSFGQSISKVNTDAIVVLPEGIKLTNIQPGQTEFDRIHPIYMRLIAIRLGIPMPLITQDGTSTNKSTIQEQRKDMYDDFKADELTIEKSINDGFFKSCKILYPNFTTEELDLIVPKFRFNDPPEDKDVMMERDLQFSLMIRNFGSAAKAFADSGNIDILKSIGLKTKQLLFQSMDMEFDPSEDNVKIEKIEKNSDLDLSIDDDVIDIDNQLDNIKKKKEKEDE